MRHFNRLTAVAVAIALGFPVLPVEARTRKGDKFYNEGLAAEQKKDWDTALTDYEQALSEDPTDVAYRIAAEKARFQASQTHLDNGLKLRNRGQLNEALVEIQKALGLNPASTAAAQEVLVTQQMIERERRRIAETGKEAPPEERALTPAEQSEQQVQKKIDRMLPVPELKPLNPELRNIKINNQPARVLFETIAKVAGINLLFDPDYQPGKNVSLDIDRSTLEEALDDVALQTKSFWQAISPTTIFVTNDNRNKRNDYEQQELKIFYLSNVNTPQELQEIVNAVRAVTELTRLMPYNSQNAIIARGEADRIALAEKIIHDLDKPKAEVVVDVIVMQATKAYSRNLTAALASTGLNVPVTFSPRTSIQVQNSTTTTNSTNTNNNSTTNNSTLNSNTTANSSTPFSIPLNNLAHLSTADYAITLPGALLQATLSDANTKILQSPEVRSVDNQKASLKIGEREPTATGSFQPGIGGVGINPLVNTQFTYIDVGVNLDLTPRVHENNEVSMHVELDISSVAGSVNLGGINQPIIQQNKVIHDLRVKDGEVSLLAGLSQQQDTKTVTGIPGLSSIPLLKRLFSGEAVDRSKSDLMIALIPHIVRRPEITAENLRGIYVGNATAVKLNYAATAGPEAPAPGNPPAPAPAAPPAAPPAAAAGTRVFFQPAQVNVAANATFNVALNVAGAADLMAAPLQIQFDPKVLRLNDIALGPLMTQGGQQPTFTKNIQNDSGTATVQLARTPGTPGLSGAGTLVNLSFQAVAPGMTVVRIPGLTLQNSQGQPIPADNPQVTITVK